jgi:hypothetical protein
MKSQRRHELQQNVLNAELARSVEFFKKWKTVIMWTVVLALMVVLAVLYTVRHYQSKRLEAQAQYDRLIRNPQGGAEEFVHEMSTLAAGDDRTLAALANLQLGEHYLRRFLLASAASGGEQNALAEQATAYYRRVIADFKDQRVALGWAHIGLAHLAESRHDPSEAAKEYQAVLSMTDLAGQPVVLQADQGSRNLEFIKTPVRMATTTSAPASSPAEKTTAKVPQTKPPATSGPATQPAANKPAKAAAKPKK